MLVKRADLFAHLAKSLYTVYYLHGDESLLIEEARDKIIACAREKGFRERQRFELNHPSEWAALFQTLQSPGLFSPKTIIDVRVSLKLDKSFGEEILSLLPYLTTDHCLILTSPKLTGAQKNASWFRHIDKEGATLAIWPLEGIELEEWVKEQIIACNITLDDKVLRLLMMYTEGHLLALRQYLQRLSLLFPNQSVDSGALQKMLRDQAQFTIYDLSAAALQGHLESAYRIMMRLKNEGVEPILILWMLIQDVHHLIQVLFGLKEGKSVESLLPNQWPFTNVYKRAALKRLNFPQLQALIRLLTETDHTLKGLLPGDPWLLLMDIVMHLCGKPFLMRRHSYDG